MLLIQIFLFCSQHSSARPFFCLIHLFYLLSQLFLPPHSIALSQASFMLLKLVECRLLDSINDEYFNKITVGITVTLGWTQKKCQSLKHVKHFSIWCGESMLSHFVHSDFSSRTMFFKLFPPNCVRKKHKEEVRLHSSFRACENLEINSYPSEWLRIMNFFCYCPLILVCFSLF